MKSCHYGQGLSIYLAHIQFKGVELSHLHFRTAYNYFFYLTLDVQNLQYGKQLIQHSQNHTMMDKDFQYI
jgi:hypothetical protein